MNGESSLEKPIRDSPLPRPTDERLPRVSSLKGVNFLDWERWERESPDKEIEDFRRTLAPLIKEAIEQIDPPRAPEQSLREHREGKCIYNDHIGRGLNREGIKVYIASSQDTGRLSSGHFSPEVMHEHGIIVAEIPKTNKIAVVDISAAMFSPINSDLQEREAIVVITRRGKEKEVCRRLYGGGKWELIEWPFSDQPFTLK